MNRDRTRGTGSDTALHRYRLTSTWVLSAPRPSVWAMFDDLADAPDPFAWWPDLAVERRDGAGIHVVTRSGLGYRLRFRLHDIAPTAPDGVTFAATGDLVGCGRVTVEEGPGDGTVLQVLWDVEVTRVWMRRSGPVLRPVFELAHAAVMRRGRRALERWLAGPGAASPDTDAPRRRRR